jgi:hypothetical protein
VKIEEIGKDAKPYRSWWNNILKNGSIKKYANIIRKILNSNLSLNYKMGQVDGYAVIVKLKNLKNVKVMGSLARYIFERTISISTHSLFKK